MSPAAPSALARLRQELEGSPRLRAGAWAILAIGFVYAALFASDWRRELQEQYRQETLRLYKVATLARQDEWLERARSARAVRKAVEAQVPVMASAGLAQAESQSWLQQVLRAFGAGMTSEARDAVPVDGKAGLWKVPIVIRGQVNPAPLMEILRRVESSERLIVVEQISIANQQRPTANITISAYYRIPTGRGGGNAGG